MLKYTEAVVSLGEVPEEISLCINISNCPIHCEGCHSPHLWGDIGEELKPVTLSNLIAKNPGITCVAFMGGDSSPKEVESLAKWVKNNTELKVCWYSGDYIMTPESPISLRHFDYIKEGPYIKEKGGLDSPTTNQVFYKIKCKTRNQISFITLDNITHKFQKNETDYKSKSIN